MKTFLANLSPADRHARSLAACQQMFTTRAFKNSQTIMIFMSMAGEVETSTLAVRAWQEGKSIAVPKVDWVVHRMEPVEIRSLDVGMQTTGPGVREPIAGTVVPLGMIDMIVVPGLAFDRQGYRVGRGKGFYDRFLAQQECKAIRCGLCFHEQVLEKSAGAIPVEPHDIPMNLVVTDAEVIRCHHEAKGFQDGNGPVAQSD
jgi:5-formyltetrahydrofolate cyclo-ligase